jgi:hypothetical protein
MRAALLSKLEQLGAGHLPSSIDDTMFGTHKKSCDVNKGRRPDMLWLSHRPARCVIWECDEDGGHPDRLQECDATWMTDMHEALTFLYRQNGYVQDGFFPHVIVLRWNPQGRDPGHHVEKETRLNVIAARIKELLDGGKVPRAHRDLPEYPTEIPTVEYYYYHSKCYSRIQHVRERCADSIHFGKAYECIVAP